MTVPAFCSPPLVFEHRCKVIWQRVSLSVPSCCGKMINCGTFRQRQSFRRNAEGDFLVPNPDYHRRQADIFTRLSETSRNADTAAALLWLATEHRARAELSQGPAQQQQIQSGSHRAWRRMPWAVHNVKMAERFSTNAVRRTSAATQSQPLMPPSTPGDRFLA